MLCKTCVRRLFSFFVHHRGEQSPRQIGLSRAGTQLHNLRSDAFTQEIKLQ